MRRFGVSGVLWLLLAGCGPPDSTPTRKPVDLDRDGVPASADCDDRDPAAHPGSVEVCDGRDNDCNGEIDDGLFETSYFDSDQDGYGNDESAIVTCGVPEGFVTFGGDCDDRDETVRPGAPERCDGVDEDCDGQIDNDAVDVGVFYRDQDGDQIGDSSASVSGCAAPEGFVSRGGDCDDADPHRFPGNAESCDGGADNDCDPATTDDGAVTYATRAGAVVDLGSIFASGTEAFPAVYYADQPGQIRFCGGEWVGALIIDADVDVVGVGGAEANVLDAADKQHSVVIGAKASVVSIEGLTFRRGHANTAGFGDSRRSGGGLFCDTGAELVLEDVVITEAEAEAGGGMYLSDCAATLSGVTLSDNVAVFGGAIAMDSGALMLVDSVVSSNTSNYYAGGAYLYNNRGDISFEMIDSFFTGNVADFVGAIYAFDYHNQHSIEASCTATGLGTAGITENTAIDFGAVYAYTPTSGAFSSSGCDFGEEDAIDDNIPEDVYHYGPGGEATEYRFGDGASFVCAPSRPCQ